MILRGFELDLGLSVNIHKIKILGFNLDPDFLEEVYDLFSYSISHFSFNLSGVPIGLILIVVNLGSQSLLSFAAGFKVGKVSSLRMKVVSFYCLELHYDNLLLLL